MPEKEKPGRREGIRCDLHSNTHHWRAKPLAPPSPHPLAARVLVSWLTTALAGVVRSWSSGASRAQADRRRVAVGRSLEIAGVRLGLRMCGLGYRLWWNRRSLCWRKARTWHGAARVGVGKNRTKRRSVVAFRWPRRLSQGGVHQLLDLSLRQVVARAGRRSYKKTN